MCRPSGVRRVGSTVPSSWVAPPLTQRTRNSGPRNSVSAGCSFVGLFWLGPQCVVVQSNYAVLAIVALATAGTGKGDGGSVVRTGPSPSDLERRNRDSQR